MNEHARKMAAPLLVVAGLLAYYGTMAFFLLTLDLPLIVKVLLGAGGLSISGVLIWVLVERMKEIQGGEEDDLSKY